MEELRAHCKEHSSGTVDRTPIVTSDFSLTFFINRSSAVGSDRSAP